MATGNYGIVRPSDVSSEDVQIFYNFTSNRQTAPGSMFELDATSLLTELVQPTTVNGIQQSFVGVKNLTLPADTFGGLGIYNIVIKKRGNLTLF